MTLHMKTLLGGAAMASALIAGASASAATVIVPFDGSPFSLANPIGTLPATKMLTGNTYDYTFSITNPVGGATFSTQLQAQSQNPAQPQLIQYQLYSGTPGSGTFIAQSSLDFSPVVAFNPSVGDYYVEVVSAE